MPATFLFAACQAGAERALKHDVAQRRPELKFAFSRPGFVTFRAPDGTREPPPLDSAFARTAGYSIGKIQGDSDSSRARAGGEVLLREWPAQSLAEFRHLHVWPRTRALPGDESFEPSLLAPVETAAAALAAELTRLAPGWSGNVNQTARTGERVLDCVLVEPGEWWLGWHLARGPESTWVGGVPPLVAPKRLVSRAYLKILEALAWSELPLNAGDHCIEIGSAPGGACLALLERGCIVTGIDPAEMDPVVVAHPGFTHVRAKAKEVKRALFRDCQWLVMDANVAPNYTLDTVEAIVTAPRVRPEGLILTLKLTDPGLVLKLAAFEKRIRGWGYRTVRMRQLAFNRQEICIVVTDPAGRQPLG